MSATESRLQSIDAGRLEELVAFYLAEKHPKPFAFLIETGHNARKRVVKDKVDGFVIYPTKPPVYGCMECTGTEERDLRKKALEDLDKAADRYRSSNPPDGSRCIVALGFSTRLSGKSDLVAELAQHAQSLGVELLQIDGSQLVRFLDFDPNGQYWRKQCLGIEADRVSIDLLRDLADKNLQLHRDRFPALPTEGSVPRKATGEVVWELRRRIGPLVVVEGGSGTGKSVLLNQVGQRFAEDGGIAFWIDEETLEESRSPNEVLQAILRRMMPNLPPTAGAEAFRLAREVGILFVCDDMVKARDPKMLFDRLREWSRIRSGDVIRFVTALWPGTLPDQRESDKSTHTVQLSLLADTEIADYVATVSPQVREKVLAASAAVGGDPFLFGVALEHLPHLTSPTIRGGTLLARLAEDLSDDGAQRMASGDERLAPSDCRLFLEQVLHKALSERELLPRPDDSFWEQSPIDRSAAVRLAGKARWGTLDADSAASRWTWSHKRMFDLLAGKCLASGEDCDTTEYLDRPELAEAWAVAIACMPDERAQLYLRRAQEEAPTVLSELARIRAFPSGHSLRPDLLTCLAAALRTVQPPQGPSELLGALFWDMTQKLLECRDPELVLDVTSGLRRDWGTRMMRTQAGELTDVLALLGSRTKNRFPPSTRFRQLERAVASFGALWEKRKSELADRLADVLRADAPQETIEGALTLCGYLGWPELCSVIGDAWKASPAGSRDRSIIYWAWTLSRCCDAPSKELLSEVLSHATKMVKAEQAASRDGGSEFVEQLRMARRFAYSEHAILVWLSAAEEEDFAPVAFYLLRQQDHPEAAKNYARWLARFPNSMLMTREGFPKERADDLGGEPPFVRGRSGLRELLGPDVEPEIRKTAFRLLGQVPVRDDLDSLRAIGEEDPLADRAHRIRAMLGDPMMAPVVADGVRRDTGWLRHVPRYLHHDSVRDAFLELTPSKDWGQVELGQALLQLPQDVLRDWVERHGDWATREPRILRYLWRTQDAKALELVGRGLAQAEDRSVEHFSHGDAWPYPVSRDMLLVVEPHLSKFTEGELEDLMETALHAGFRDWTRARVEHLREGDRERYFPSDQRVVRALEECRERAASNMNPWACHSGFLLEEFWDKELVLRVLKEWVTGTDQQLVAVQLVAIRGEPEDLAWLARSPGVDDLPPTVIDEPRHSCWRRVAKSL